MGFYCVALGRASLTRRQSMSTLSRWVYEIHLCFYGSVVKWSEYKVCLIEAINTSFGLTLNDIDDVTWIPRFADESRREFPRVLFSIILCMELSFSFTLHLFIQICISLSQAMGNAYGQEIRGRERECKISIERKVSSSPLTSLFLSLIFCPYAFPMA